MERITKYAPETQDLDEVRSLQLDAIHFEGTLDVLMAWEDPDRLRRFPVSSVITR